MTNRTTAEGDRSSEPALRLSCGGQEGEVQEPSDFIEGKLPA